MGEPAYDLEATPFVAFEVTTGFEFNWSRLDGRPEAVETSLMAETVVVAVVSEAEETCITLLRPLLTARLGLGPEATGSVLLLVRPAILVTHAHSGSIYRRYEPQYCRFRTRVVTFGHHPNQ